MKGVLDKEWLQLILQAKSLGLTVEEIRHFFHAKFDNPNGPADIKRNQSFQTLAGRNNSQAGTSACTFTKNLEKDLSMHSDGEVFSL